MGLALIAVLLAGTSIYRRRALVVAAGCAAIVGICNLVLGYHWLSEVVAGWFLGTLVVTVAASLLPRKTLVPTVTDGGTNSKHLPALGRRILTTVTSCRPAEAHRSR